LHSQAAQSHIEAAKAEANIPSSNSSSHRSRRAPREVLSAEANAIVEAEFRMLAHARHFVAAEADALHKEVSCTSLPINFVVVSCATVRICDALHVCRFCSFILSKLSSHIRVCTIFDLSTELPLMMD
jgi:hypothetical protein